MFIGRCDSAHTRVIFQLRPRKLGQVPPTEIVGSCVAYSLQAKT